MSILKSNIFICSLRDITFVSLDAVASNSYWNSIIINHSNFLIEFLESFEWLDTRCWFFFHGSQGTANGAVLSTIFQISILSEHDLGYQLSQRYNLYGTSRAAACDPKRNRYEDVSVDPFYLSHELRNLHLHFSSLT